DEGASARPRGVAADAGGGLRTIRGRLRPYLRGRRDWGVPRPPHARRAHLRALAAIDAVDPRGDAPRARRSRGPALAGAGRARGLHPGAGRGPARRARTLSHARAPPSWWRRLSVGPLGPQDRALRRADRPPVTRRWRPAGGAARDRP